MRHFFKLLMGWQVCPDCLCYHKWTMFNTRCGKCGYVRYLREIKPDLKET